MEVWLCCHGATERCCAHRLVRSAAVISKTPGKGSTKHKERAAGSVDDCVGIRLCAGYRRSTTPDQYIGN